MLLTIGIPTFNRASYLRENLECIFSQITPEMHPVIRIVISDNASEDETAKVVKEFESRGIEILYVRNETNLGPDGNFLTCLDAMGQTRYFMLIGDDDWFNVGKLAKIIKFLIKNDDIDVMFLECRNRYAKIIGKSDFLRFERDDFISFINYHVTFMSCFIFPYSAFGDVRKTLDSMVGTRLIQLGWVIPQILKSRKLIVFSELAIGATVDNTGGYSFHQVFVNNFWDIWREFTEIPEWLTNRVLFNMILTFYPNFIIQSRKQKDNKFFIENDFMSDYTDRMGMSSSYKIILQPLFKLPLPLAALYARSLVIPRQLFYLMMAYRFRRHQTADRVSTVPH